MLGDMLHSNDSALEQCTRDLTAQARAGKLEPVRCRDDEIARVMDILLRQSKNNPALVGAAGVGKTAIAEGLAQRVASGTVPLALRRARILALDHVSLLAGTMFRGQYEERLKGVVAAASADPDTILFIDELHNLMGQGTAMGVAMDAANMLKPALVRGEFRVIGATTQDEYDRWICGDPALERRFQKVTVRELSAEHTLEILEARRERLERHHNVAIADEALRASVVLTDRFITDRARPDRAIDALDEACAHTQAVAVYPPDLEAMIVERRELVRAAEREVSAEQVREQAAANAAAVEDEDDDMIERMARDGIAALERFGAEIEAAFARQPVGGPTRQPAPADVAPSPPTEPEPRAPEARRGSTRGRLAVVEADLNRRLVDAGFVVRAHDVARVISVATGQTIQWSE
ncbi:MAG TPA: AAA family ATPase [Gemmatimonadaceae bacterium]|nr:AAA family ATPase [Gemmatimonadaceae bacterium]